MTISAFDPSGLPTSVAEGASPSPRQNLSDHELAECLVRQILGHGADCYSDDVMIDSELWAVRVTKLES